MVVEILGIFSFTIFQELGFIPNFGRHGNSLGDSGFLGIFLGNGLGTILALLGFLAIWARQVPISLGPNQGNQLTQGNFLSLWKFFPNFFFIFGKTYNF